MSLTSLNIVILLLGSLSAVKINGCFSMSTFNTVNKIALDGKTFDEVFSKGRYLGKGNFGVVREIKWGKKRAAAKEVAMPANIMIKALQEREINILKVMSGKNSAVNFYDCAVDDKKGKIYLVQEKLYKDLESKGVAQKLRSMPLHKRLLRYIKIAEAYQSLHKNNITHQDLKMANIMAVDNKLSKFRIIDFGLSAMINDPIVGGSPIYNAPEKVNNQNVVGKANVPAFRAVYASTSHDLYALGMTLAFMETTTDKILFNFPSDCVLKKYTSECSATLLQNIRNALNEKGQDKLAEIIERSMDFDRFKRTATMEDLKNELIELYNAISKEQNLPLITDSSSLNDIISSKVELENAVKAYEVLMAQKEYTMKDANLEKDEKLIQFPMNKDSEELIDDMTDMVSDYFNFLKLDKVLLTSHLI